MEGRTVTFEWVKGHAGHPLNELADDLARACAQTYQEGGTPAPGPGFRSRGKDEADGAQRPAGSAGTPGGTDPDGTATGQEPPGSGPDGKEGGQEHPGSGTEPTDSGPADGAASSTAAEPRGGRGRRSARGERPFSPHPSVGGAPEPATAVGPEPTEAADPSPGEPVGPEPAPSWPAGPGASAAGDPSALEPEPAPDRWRRRGPDADHRAPDHPDLARRAGDDHAGGPRPPEGEHRAFQRAKSGRGIPGALHAALGGRVVRGVQRLAARPRPGAPPVHREGLRPRGERRPVPGRGEDESSRAPPNGCPGVPRETDPGTRSQAAPAQSALPRPTEAPPPPVGGPERPSPSRRALESSPCARSRTANMATPSTSTASRSPSTIASAAPTPP